MDQSADLFELASGIDEVCARLEDTCNALRILDQLLSPESLPPAPAANADRGAVRLRQNSLRTEPPDRPRQSAGLNQKGDTVSCPIR